MGNRDSTDDANNQNKKTGGASSTGAYILFS